MSVLYEKSVISRCGRLVNNLRNVLGEKQEYDKTQVEFSIVRSIRRVNYRTSSFIFGVKRDCESNGRDRHDAKCPG